MNHSNFNNPLDSDHLTQGEFRRSLPELRRLLDDLIRAVQGLQRSDVEKNGALRINWVNDGPIYSLDPSALPSAEDITAIWRYSTSTTMSDPGDGYVRANAGTFAAADQLAISVMTDKGIDVTSFLRSLMTGDVLTIQERDDSTNWVRYTINDTPSDNGSWFLLPVDFVLGGGTAPSNNTPLLLTFNENSGGGGGGGVVTGTPTVVPYFNPSGDLWTTNLDLQYDATSGTLSTGSFHPFGSSNDVGILTHGYTPIFPSPSGSRTSLALINGTNPNLFGLYLDWNATAAQPSFMFYGQANIPHLTIETGSGPYTYYNGQTGTDPIGNVFTSGLCTTLGTGSISGTGTVTSITAGAGLSGGTITTTGTLAVIYGTTAGTAAQGNDSRLSDARTPVGTTLPAGDIWVGSSGSVAAAVGVTGDVSLTSLGAVTIAANSVTYAKLQDVSAASKLLGRGSASGAGDPEEITLGAGLTMTGTTLSATGGGTGTVTSVGLSLPAELTVTGSPVTTSGTLTAAWASVNQNYFLAGSATGGAGTPAFRGLHPNDFGLTTKGDLIAAYSGSILGRRAVGTDGLFLKADSSQASGLAWAAPAGFTSPLTTKGDVHTYSTVDTRLGVGSNGQVLTADSAQTTGLKWADLPAIPGMLLGTNYVLAEQTTTSTSYMNWTTTPDEVTVIVPAGTHDLLVMYHAFWGQDNTVSGINYNEVFLDGTGQANSEHFNGVTATRDIATICNYRLTGVAGGSRVIAVRHKVNAAPNTGYWKNRMLSVWLAS